MGTNHIATTSGQSGGRIWIAELSATERNTLIATFGGWALDGMDVMVYSLVIPTLIATWHISNGQAGALATVALLVSAAGGWLAGILADHFGRARTLQITIAWFAFFTFLSGFTHSFSSLLIVRALQGLGFGGEWAVGSVLMGETIRAEHRGKAVGTVQSGWALGWGVAALAYVIFFNVFPPEIAWRTMFWIGILPALLVLYIRRYVPEPEVFVRAVAEKTDRQRGYSLAIFSRTFLRTTFLTSMMAIGAQGGYHAITTWLPTYLKIERGLSVLDTGAYLSAVIVGSFIGYLVSAYLADRLGRKATLISYAICSLIVVIAYMLLPFGNHAMLALGFLLGFFASGSFSPMGAFLTELFPTSIRGSGQGFSYNVGRGVGALFPSLIGVLSTSFSLRRAIAAFAILAYSIMITSVLFLPETRGQALADVNQ